MYLLQDLRDLLVVIWSNICSKKFKVHALVHYNSFNNIDGYRPLTENFVKN